MQHNLINGVARTACVLVLSLSMAASPLVEGFAAALAFADEPTQETTGQQPVQPEAGQPAEGDGQKEAASEEAPETTVPPRISEEVPLETPAANKKGAQATQDSTNPESAPNAGDANAPQSDKYVASVLELAKDQEPAPAAGAVIVDGLKYRINSDGKTAELAGWNEHAVPQGDVTVAAKVVSGGDEYVVASVAKEALKNCDKIELIVLPDSVAEIGKDAFAGCTALRAIEVGEACERFATRDGMLFSKDLATLIRCPEGKGAGGGGSLAALPSKTNSLAEDAFAGCVNLTGIEVEEGSATFASANGLLCSKDLTRLVYAPAGIGASVTLPEGIATIGTRAFAECSALTSIVVAGEVTSIEDGAFSAEVIANATVALPATDTYTTHKAVWEKAGFGHFSEPAAPGDTVAPKESGFAYTLLDDLTLAVSWTGDADPEADLVIPATAELNGMAYSVSTIAQNGFANRSSIKNLTIPASVTTIGGSAFEFCTNLSQVSLPDGLVSIGANAFAGTALQTVVLPKSLTNLGGGVIFSMLRA